MAESCQAYKCTYGSRLEYLFSFIIFLFFPLFFYHQVSSLLATLPLRRNSRKELHFWWELIRQAFTWNSSRLLRVPELGWWRYNLLRGTNCSNFCSGTERAQRSASHRLYFAEQNRRDSEKQTPKRQKVNQSTKADFTLLTKKKKPSSLPCCILPYLHLLFWVHLHRQIWQLMHLNVGQCTVKTYFPSFLYSFARKYAWKYSIWDKNRICGILTTFKVNI